MASGSTPVYALPYPLITDGVDITGDMQDLATSVEGVLLTKSSNAAVALKAPIDSPVFTGVPITTTPAVNDNTTKVASTAFVIGQASNVLPLMNNTATIGTSLRYARADHIHESDTTKANLSGATFTGNITGTSASFSGLVSGITPLNDNDLATKAYVDSNQPNTNSFFLMGA
jgi:hypothetical protein